MKPLWNCAYCGKAGDHREDCEYLQTGPVDWEALKQDMLGLLHRDEKE